MQVQHEVNDRALQSGAHALVNSEPGAGDLGCALEVEDVQIFADVPVGFHLEALFSRGAPLAQLDIIAVVYAFLYVFIRCVRHVQQSVAQSLFCLGDLSVQFLDIVGELLELCHQFGRILAFFLIDRDLLRGSLLMVLHLLHSRQQFSSLLVQLHDLAQSEVAFASQLDRFFDAFVVFSDSLDI